MTPTGRKSRNRTAAICSRADRDGAAIEMRIGVLLLDVGTTRGRSCSLLMMQGSGDEDGPSAPSGRVIDGARRKPGRREGGNESVANRFDGPPCGRKRDSRRRGSNDCRGGQSPTWPRLRQPEWCAVMLDSYIREGPDDTGGPVKLLYIGIRMARRRARHSQAPHASASAAAASRPRRVSPTPTPHPRGSYVISTRWRPASTITPRTSWSTR